MNKQQFFDTLPILASADIIVAGGGLSGCAAAIAAARAGADVLLIESGGCLGGAATAGLVAPISSTCSTDEVHKFGGILQELLDDVTAKAKKYCASSIHPTSSLHLYKYILLDMLKSSGAKLLFHLFITDVVSDENGAVRYIVVSSKDGLKRIEGKIFIDTTGDGDIMGKSAADTIIGSEPNVLADIADTGLLKSHDKQTDIPKDDYAGKLQPVSLMMQFGGVDVKRAKMYMNKKITYADFGITKEEFAEWPYAGTLGFEIDDSEYIPMPQGRVWLCPAIREGVATINMSRVLNINACDPLSYSEAEEKAGLQLIAIIDFLLTFVPGFENAYFMESSSTLGIRESRRLIGDYVLRGREVICCQDFKDTIAHGSYIIDIHDPKGKRMAIGGNIRKTYYSIPYGCLVTKKVPNLATAGRSISADHVAMSATRIQGTAILTGQAAGTAAAMALESGCAMSDIDVPTLQRKLIGDGVYLDIPKCED